jgi:Integrase core domain/GAG-pre-integrase domain
MLSAPAHVSMDVLHRRLGHPSSAVMHHLISSKCADGIKMNLNSQLSAPCLACLQAKQPAVAHRVSESVTHRPLELVHVDLMGPLPKSMGGSQYIFVALDDFSRLSHVECLGSKGDAGPALLAVIALWERAMTRKVISVRSDRGKEFCNQFVDAVLRREGITHQTTVRYSSRQNGRAERVNRDIMEKARALLFQSQLPRKLWAEAVTCACRLRNVLPNLGRSRTPFELFYGHIPDLSRLRVFGCVAHVQVPKTLRKKLDPRSEPGVMVGYAKNAKAWRVAMKDSRGHVSVVERDSVVFDESKSGFQSPQSPLYDDENDMDLDILG